MKTIKLLLSTCLIVTSLLFAGDQSEVTDVVKKHWEYQNKKN